MDFDDIRAGQVHILDHQGSSREVVRTFIGQGLLCYRAIVSFASDFDRKDGGTIQETHPCRLADIEGCVRAK